MTDHIEYGDIVAMLRRSVEIIEAEHKQLSELDSISGDGDHGTTMVRAMKLVAKAVDEHQGTSVKTLLKAVGWNLLGVDGGATGPLFGTLFRGMSDFLEEGKPLTMEVVAGMFEAGLASMQRITKAVVGDKTMMDALIPAVRSLTASAAEGTGFSEAFRAAKEAAEKGAAGTGDMIARLGRAKNLGERTRGHQDPGATSVSFIFKGFCEGLSQRG